MLILTRRPGETIAITTPSGETIKVQFIERKGNQIRLGFDAPKEITIMRDDAKSTSPHQA